MIVGIDTSEQCLINHVGIRLSVQVALLDDMMIGWTLYSVSWENILIIRMKMV